MQEGIQASERVKGNLKGSLLTGASVGGGQVHWSQPIRFLISWQGARHEATSMNGHTCGDGRGAKHNVK